jgi:hypothetical protein
MAAEPALIQAPPVAPEAAAGTRLFVRQYSDWGVPPGVLHDLEFTLALLRRDVGVGLGVRRVRWFREADQEARDGDPDTFRERDSRTGYLAWAAPDTIWLRKELCALGTPPGRMGAALTRALVHEVAHADQAARGSRLPEAELERLADALGRVLCRGLLGVGEGPD